MRRDEFAEMRAFLEVAKQRSFTKAAARMGVTTSALSHTIKALEARLGVRVLARTTRDVAPTAAGERLRAGIEPHFAAIAAQVEALGDVSEQVSGHVRIVCTDDSVDTVFRPVLPGFLRDHPGVKVELMVDNGLSNIVESQFDAGVRFGDSVAKDMVAVRIGPDVTYCIVGSPAYFARRLAPTIPQGLVEHDRINYRLPTAGSVYAWELQDEGRDSSVRVEGQLILDNTGPVLQAGLMFQESWLKATLRPERCGMSSRAGARFFRDTICITRAGVTIRPRLVRWWRRYGTAKGSWTWRHLVSFFRCASVSANLLIYGSEAVTEVALWQLFHPRSRK